MEDLIKEKKEYTVNIFGKNYPLKTSNDEEFVNKVARILDDEISEVSKQVGSIGEVKTVILSALNIIEKNLKENFDNYKILSEKETSDKELEHYKDLFREAKEKYISFQNENDMLRNQNRNLETDLENKVTELEEELKIKKEKYRELENSFFEIQSENIKLKNNL